jgi:hypothetical protein
MPPSLNISLSLRVGPGPAAALPQIGTVPIGMEPHRWSHSVITHHETHHTVIVAQLLRAATGSSHWVHSTAEPVTCHHGSTRHVPKNTV